jgi:hypothetical protein
MRADRFRLRRLGPRGGLLLVVLLLLGLCATPVALTTAAGGNVYIAAYEVALVVQPDIARPAPRTAPSLTVAWQPGCPSLDMVRPVFQFALGRWDISFRHCAHP